TVCPRNLVRIGIRNTTGERVTTLPADAALTDGTNLTSMWRNPSHPDRPLDAVVRPAGPGMFAAVRAALSGEGPAVLPLPPGQADAAVAALRPTHVNGEPHAAGSGVPPEVAVVIATSGSTGTPKGVMLSATALRF